MSLILEQTFLTGRFHATRWNQNPYEDSHGEWPPSPWRLLRTLAARWFENARETGVFDEPCLERLLQKLAEKPPVFHLPCNTSHSQDWPARGIKQYQRTSLEKSNPAAGQPWVKRAQTTLVVDTFVHVPGEEPLLWIWPDLELDPASAEGLLLEQLLRRITYFGRAESLSHLRRLSETESHAPANCWLSPDAYNASPVLVVAPGQPLSIETLLANTDDKLLKGRRVPPGTCWWYAKRPGKVALARATTVPSRAPTSQIQFAVGGRVFPEPESWIRLTERFRGRAIKALAEIVTGDGTAKFAELSVEQRVQYSAFSGKDAEGKALSGHQHIYFWLIPDANGKPTRLVCHRTKPFDTHEQEALLQASEFPIAWQFGNPDWQLRLVPLPQETPLPSVCLAKASTWKTIVPYVPVRHILGRNGHPRPGRSIEQEIQQELAQAGRPPATVEVKPESQWLKVHRSSRKEGPTNDLKRGYHVTLRFDIPVTGPITLGQSSHFGLGLFTAKNPGTVA